MSPDVKDALEAARSSAINTESWRGVSPQRLHSFERVRVIVLSVLRELPDDLTIKDLREELEDAFHD